MALTLYFLRMYLAMNVISFAKYQNSLNHFVELLMTIADVVMVFVMVTLELKCKNLTLNLGYVINENIRECLDLILIIIRERISGYVYSSEV